MLSQLLGSGSWVRRAKFGWLPAAYMRHLPAVYRGVDPVIDHDHGSPPGLNGHSDVLPSLPPVKIPEKPKELPKWVTPNPNPDPDTDPNPNPNPDLDPDPDPNPNPNPNPNPKVLGQHREALRLYMDV